MVEVSVIIRVEISDKDKFTVKVRICFYVWLNVRARLKIRVLSNLTELCDYYVYYWGDC